MFKKDLSLPKNNQEIFDFVIKDNNNEKDDEQIKSKAV